MKGQIVKCTISDGAVAALHGMRYNINRLVIPEDGLTITPHRGNVYVHKDVDFGGTVVAEIEVDDSIIDNARSVAVSSNRLALDLAAADSPLHEYFLKQFGK